MLSVPNQENKMVDDMFDESAHTSDGKPRANSTFDAVAAELQSFVERYNAIEDEIAARREDKKELIAELKGRGFDCKAFDATLKVIKIREDRAKVEARLEMRAIATLYLTALGQDDFEELL
jgi:uncharacterized protein (UPF0335 family)